MTQTNDPPLISSIELIPDAAEKADLDAPNDSGGKLVVGQAPNITITETTVVADAAERLGLDVQEGDIAIQSNVSTSFIFTGGDNVANNWETIDFDAVGAIDGEDINPRDITPRNITATGDISLQDLTVAGEFNGADTSAASAGEALTSDGSGSFTFASVGGDVQNLMSDLLTQSNMSQIAASQSDMQEVINTGLIQNVAASQTAMAEVAASQTAMQEVAGSFAAMKAIANSRVAMIEVGNSSTARNEIENSTAAIQALNGEVLNGSQQVGDNLTTITDLSNQTSAVYLKSIFAPRSGNQSCENELSIPDQGISLSNTNNAHDVTVEGFVTLVEHGQCTNFNGPQGPETTYEYIPI